MGKRAGAVTVSLDSWHLDIPEFLECQTENGDQRRKAYDIFPQLVVSDLFMRRVESNADWTLIDPHEVREKLGVELAELWGEAFEETYRDIESHYDSGLLTLGKRVNARELFKQIMRTQVETGMPYLAFKDTINRANPNKHEGYIPGVNLCVESFSNVSPGVEMHVCNLVSLNLANLIDSDDLEDACHISVRILDNTIELTNPPTESAAQHNNKYRTIGVGAMGLADWLAVQGLKYQDTREISLLFENIAYACTDESARLARERGAYPAFDGSSWSEGLLLGCRTLEEVTEASQSPEHIKSRWAKLRKRIIEGGIRNSHITAIAPNTSSSLVQGCTASILPAYSRFFYDKWAKGTVPIAPAFIRDSFWYYQEGKTLDQTHVIDAVATMQQWIDTGISMELTFNLNAGVYFPEDPERSLKAKDIFDCMVAAWSKGCKAVYYTRTIQKDSFLGEACVSCAN